MSRISTHVLDISLGKPARDVTVRLERQQSTGGWLLLHSSGTDGDGRCAELLPEEDALHPGRYRLAFDTARYYGDQKIQSLYPVVEITFEVAEGQSHFHIPLLLSPHGYTTYRGS